MATTSKMKNEQRWPAGNEVGKYTMGVAIWLTGVAAHRIRRFEAAGLLELVRTQAGQRLYSDSDCKMNSLDNWTDRRLLMHRAQRKIG